jgi:hypothetical protein
LPLRDIATAVLTTVVTTVFKKDIFTINYSLKRLRCVCGVKQFAVNDRVCTTNRVVIPYPLFTIDHNEVAMEDMTLKDSCGHTVAIELHEDCPLFFRVPLAVIEVGVAGAGAIAVPVLFELSATTTSEQPHLVLAELADHLLLHEKKCVSLL